MILSVAFWEAIFHCLAAGMNQIDPASPSSVGKPEKKKYPVENLSMIFVDFPDDQ